MSEFDDSGLNDWGDDPFEGDMDFDMDFDSPGSKKGFLRSFVSGFLDGVVEQTIGSTDAKINTLHRILPSTWSPTFRNLREFNQRRKEVMEELKNNSFQTVQDLQYLAMRAAKAVSGKVPNKISGGLSEFSKYDFSDWEKHESTSDDSLNMEETTNEEIKALLTNEDANSILERETVERVGSRTIGMMTEVGGRTIAGMHAVTQTNMRTNQLLEHLLDYQRSVQQRNDNLQLTVAARQLLTSSKFYKFVEASNHRMITELKVIAEYSKQSDYEKTSNSQALKRNIRETVFNTAKSKFGGIGEFLQDRFGKDARQDMADSVGDITSSLRMVAEMTEGMPINVGSMMGNAAAGIFLNNLPKLLGSDKAKEYLAKFKKQFPAMSKWAENAYIRIADLGNVATYITSNPEELANSLAKHYQGGNSITDDDTYEEYVDRLPTGSKPMPKTQWRVLHTARKMGNKAAESVLDDMWEPTNTKYNLTQRTLADSHDQALWTRRSDRTLNEEIPRWFGMLHLSLEKIRTGNDKLSAVSYDYVKANFVNDHYKAATVTNAVFDRGQFSSQATAANNLANAADEHGLLSKKAKEALAFQLAKDADKKLGFNPYNLMDLESEGHSKETAAEIKKAIMATYDITEEHIDAFVNGDEVTRGKMLGYMPTEKGRRILPGMADAARSLGTFMPDIANNLDIHKSAGYFEAMKQAGIIAPSQYGGGDEISEEKFWNVLKEFIKDPEKKRLVEPPKDVPLDPTRPYGQFIPKPGPQPFNPFAQPPVPIPSLPQFDLSPKSKEPVNVKMEGLEDILKSLDGLKGVASSMNMSSDAFKGLDKLNLTPLNTGMDLLVKNVGALLVLAQTRNETLSKIQEGLPARKKPPSKQEQEDLRSGTNKLIDKIKEFSFKDFYNKAVDTVLRNEPLILGGLLGGLAGFALHNPKAAALVAGGALAATAYGKLRGMAKATTPEDTEDLYEEGSDEPILEARRLREGQYYDLTKNKIINSWKEITGSVKIVSTDAYNGTVIGARKLANKLFTSENKEVFLSGLNKVRELLSKMFNWMDPIGRAKAFGSKIATRFFQMDVYKEGSKTPTLIGKSFAGGAYYKLDANGKATAIDGWNEIDGPVYDREGNILITQEEYDRGLTTSMGVSINKMSSAARKLGGWGLDAFKVIKDKAAEYGGKAYDKGKEALKADYTPIISSIDRIYYLLMDHWGYKYSADSQEGGAPPHVPNVDEPHNDPDVTGPAPDVVAKREEDNQNPPEMKKHDMSQLIKDKLNDLTGRGKERKNSLKDQADQKKEKKNNKVKDAIIDIASNFGFGEKEKKPERAGLFGMLASMMGGAVGLLGTIGGFFTKMLWPSIRIMTTFASLGLKALPMMVTGISAIAKGIFTLLKTRSLTAAGGSIMDSIFGDRDEDPEARRRRRDDTTRRRRSPGGRFKMGGMALGVGMLASTVTDGMVDAGIADEDGLVDNLGGAIGTAATVYGGYQLAAGAAGLMGVSLGGVAASVGGALLSGVLAVGGGALALLSSPWVLGALAVGAIGYGVYKLFQEGKGTQIKLRLTQYGLSDVESDLAEKVIKAEQALEKFVVIGNGRASISKDAPIAEVFKIFVTDPNDKDQISNVFTWFNGRFKPVFLTYMACLDAGKFKGLEEYDKSTDQNVYNIAKQAHSALGGVNPFPYTIVAKIDKDTPILAEKQTVIRVNNYLEELKKYVDRKSDSDTLKPVGTAIGETALLTEKKKLQDKLDNSGDTLSTAAKRDIGLNLDMIDKRLAGLSSDFKVGPQVAAIFIKDLLPDDKAVDLLTAIRLAAYGNEDDSPWRVAAVLKLERYCEKLFVNNGKEVVFTGDIGELFGLFKDSFRLKSDEGNDWCKWFRDRFAPVMRNYVSLLGGYRKGNPGAVWKSLSVTARYEIAQGLIDTKVHIATGLSVPVWKVRASPFKDSVSPDRYDKVDRMLKLLGEASSQAKLRDPEKEAGKTNTSAWAKAISPHKVGGGLSEHAANVQQAKDYKSRKDVIMGGQFGTNVNHGAGTGNVYGLNGSYGTPENKFGYKALTGDSDTSHLDMTGAQKDSGGKDTGVKVPRKLAEQLMIREMLKQGFTDPRAIAEMLALTNYETGGYSKTVESLKYSDPARLMKMFREVTTLEQAKALVGAGEVATANAVYGGAKGRSLGNTDPGDGYKYRGRGFVQLTGKENYAKTGASLGLDLVNKPELLSEDPNVMAAVAVEFFKNSKLLQGITADGNFGRAATGLNGGNPLPGMGDRYKLYLSYLEQLNKGELKADDDSATEAGKDVVGSAPVAPPSTPTSGPSIGGPAGVPPLGASPTGGMLDNSGGGNYSTPAGGGASGAYGGTMPGNENGPGPIISSGANSDNSGLRVKSEETTAGGDSHPGIKRLGQLIQTNVQTFKQITAMNDRWHQQRKPGSKHAKGLAIDFTTTDGVASSDAAVATVKGILQQAGLQPSEFLVLNEYRRKSAGATGGHVHAGFSSAEAADKFNRSAGGNAANNQDTTAGGGGVQQKDPTEIPQQGVEATAPRGMEEPEAGSEEPAARNKPFIPGAPPPRGNPTGGGDPSAAGSPFSTSPNAQMNQQGGNNGNQNPRQAATQPPAAAPQAAPADNSAVEKLLEQLIVALKEQGGSQGTVLVEAVKQLSEINKNTKTPQKRVGV